MKTSKKKLMITFILSIVMAVVMIIHGIFFDLDWSQISRLTAEGFFATFIIVFVSLLILEKLFVMEEDENIKKIKGDIRKLRKEEKRLDILEKVLLKKMKKEGKFKKRKVRKK